MQTLSRRKLLKLAAGTFAAGAGCAALSGQSRRGKWVTVKSDIRSVNCYMCQPQANPKAPALIVIHEAYGLTDWVQSVTDEFAEAGFLALAPDLLSGMAPNGGGSKDLNVMAAQTAVINLPVPQITSDLNAVADYSKTLPNSNGKLCVAGFAWGGCEALRMATNRKDLAAAFVFYGHLAPKAVKTNPMSGDFANIEAMIYGFYAQMDDRVNLSTVQNGLKAAGKPCDIQVYEGARQGFMRTAEEANAEDADKKARAAAWTKVKQVNSKYM